jgi:hypothetical protein
METITEKAFHFQLDRKVPHLHGPFTADSSFLVTGSLILHLF